MNNERIPKSVAIVDDDITAHASGEEARALALQAGALDSSCKPFIGAPLNGVYAAVGSGGAAL